MTSPSSPAREQDTATLDPRRWMALAVLAVVQFMFVLDLTVVNVALPHIQHDLGLWSFALLLILALV